MTHSATKCNASIQTKSSLLNTAPFAAAAVDVDVDVDIDIAANNVIARSLDDVGNLKTAKFERGNADDYKALNAIWKRVGESLSRSASSHQIDDKSAAIIRQRLFVLLSSEYLRIRCLGNGAPLDIDHFLRSGADALDRLCAAKTAHFDHFQHSMRSRIRCEFEREVAALRAQKLPKNTKRYQYVYSPPADPVAAH